MSFAFPWLLIVGVFLLRISCAPVSLEVLQGHGKFLSLAKNTTIFLHHGRWSVKFQDQSVHIRISGRILDWLRQSHLALDVKNLTPVTIKRLSRLFLDENVSAGEKSRNKETQKSLRPSLRSVFSSPWVSKRWLTVFNHVHWVQEAPFSFAANCQIQEAGVKFQGTWGRDAFEGEWNAQNFRWYVQEKQGKSHLSGQGLSSARGHWKGQKFSLQRSGKKLVLQAPQASGEWIYYENQQGEGIKGKLNLKPLDCLPAMLSVLFEPAVKVKQWNFARPVEWNFYWDRQHKLRGHLSTQVQRTHIEIHDRGKVLSVRDIRGRVVYRGEDETLHCSELEGYAGDKVRLDKGKVTVDSKGVDVKLKTRGSLRTLMRSLGQWQKWNGVRKVLWNRGTYAADIHCYIPLSEEENRYDVTGNLQDVCLALKQHGDFPVHFRRMAMAWKGDTVSVQGLQGKLRDQRITANWQYHTKTRDHYASVKGKVWNHNLQVTGRWKGAKGTVQGQWGKMRLDRLGIDTQQRTRRVQELYGFWGAQRFFLGESKEPSCWDIHFENAGKSLGKIQYQRSRPGHRAQLRLNFRRWDAQDFPWNWGKTSENFLDLKKFSLPSVWPSISCVMEMGTLYKKGKALLENVLLEVSIFQKHRWVGILRGTSVHTQKTSYLTHGDQGLVEGCGYDLPLWIYAWTTSEFPAEYIERTRKDPSGASSLVLRGYRDKNFDYNGNYTLRRIPLKISYGVLSFFSLLSPAGWFHAFQGDNLGRLQGKFTLSSRQKLLILQKSEITDQDMQAFFHAHIDFARHWLDARGSIVPMRAVNSVLRWTPLRLWTGKEGLFSVPFRVYGPWHDLRVNTSVFSGLLPQFLRGDMKAVPKESSP